MAQATMTKDIPRTCGNVDKLIVPKMLMLLSSLALTPLLQDLHSSNGIYLSLDALLWLARPAMAAFLGRVLC